MSGWVSLLLDGVGDEHAGVLLLIQKHHGSEISYAFLAVARAGDHPHTLHLGREISPRLERLDITSQSRPWGELMRLDSSEWRKEQL